MRALAQDVGLTGRLRLRHRMRALRGAAAAVSDPARLIAGEFVMLPLRPLALAYARLGGVTPEKAWWTLTRPLGGQVSVHVLRANGRRVHLRRGTPDIFTLYETHATDTYLPPPAAAAALDALDRPPRILDLGANIGLFALAALGRWPGAQITSFEPDPANLELLRLNVAANADVRWDVVAACAATHDGELPFMAGHFAVSRTSTDARADETIRVPARDVMPLLETCDLLKMDIEGGEWAILADPRLPSLRAAVVVMEYHAWGAPSARLGDAARSALEGVGYAVGPAGRLEPGSGMLWAWRRRE